MLTQHQAKYEMVWSLALSLNLIESNHTLRDTDTVYAKARSHMPERGPPMRGFASSEKVLAQLNPAALLPMGNPSIQQQRR